MWIGLSILFRDSAAALTLYRMFFSELAAELQAIGSTLQHLSWAEQAQWSSSFLLHQLQRQPPVDPGADEALAAAAAAAANSGTGADAASATAPAATAAAPAAPAAKFDDKKKGSTKNKLKDRLKRALEDKKEAVKEASVTAVATAVKKEKKTGALPDLKREVFFSGYPNYPPELTRLTRRKLEDVLANLSFLAYLSATLSLDSSEPALACFATLATRGFLPASMLRVNMSSLVFPQLIFEVWVNLPIVFCETILTHPTRKTKTHVDYYHSLRLCLSGRCTSASCLLCHSPHIDWPAHFDHICCQALGLVRLADVRSIDQVHTPSQTCPSKNKRCDGCLVAFCGSFCGFARSTSVALFSVSFSFCSFSSFFFCLLFPGC